MIAKELPSQQLLNETFYITEDWLIKRKCNDDYAFNIIDTGGYKVGKFKNKKYKAHRIIWKMIHGYDPYIIDHIDGNRLNNNISNLRNSDEKLNSRNRKLGNNNSSGYTGIRECVYTGKGKTTKTYRVHISVNGIQISLGSYENLNLALEARKEGERYYWKKFQH